MSIYRNFFFNLLLIFSQLIFPILVLPYVNRVLGPSNIGVFNLVDNFAQYFITIAALGIPIYGVREISKSRVVSQSSLNKTFCELITINIVLTVFCIIIYILFLLFSITVQKNFIFYFIGLIQVISGVFSLEWYFQGIENFKFIAIRTFIIRIISVIVIYLLVKSKSDTILYYLITTFAFFVTAVLNIYYLSKNIKYKFPSLSSLKKHIKPLFTFFTTKFMISIYVTLTTILLGFLSTEKDVGYFSLSFKVFNIIVVIVSSLATVMISRSSVVADSNKEAFDNLIQKAYYFNIFISLPLLAIVSLYAKEIILLLGGSDFLPMVDSLRFLSVLIFIIPLSNLFALNILTPLKREHFFLRATMIGTIISLILNFSLIPEYGYKGATYAFLTTETVVWVLLFYYAFQSHKFNLNLSFVIKSFITCLMFVPIYYFLPNIQPYVKLLLGTIASLLIYSLVHIFIIKNNIVLMYLELIWKRILPAK